jgi:putative Mg2+ transporter-C (MgtC) family protein
MQINPDWYSIALRLVLTIIAGTLIGINRSEHGRPAGLRTTLLVCLAASIAMIQTNLLLNMAGKQADSFVTLDLMRLPLGILSGMGFIGAGTILRRDDLVLGITTAATLWFVTVLGLCFGGGQLLLGSVATVIGLIVLWSLQWVERRIPQDRYATLVATLGADGPSEGDVLSKIQVAGLQVMASGVTYDRARQHRELRCEVRWKANATQTSPPSFIRELTLSEGVSKVDWSPRGLSPEFR